VSEQHVPVSAEIAVVVPCRNAAPWVAEALDSLADQHLAPREVLVVDDGSTDGSADVVVEWTAAHPRLPFDVRVIRQGPLGVAAAVNRGVAETGMPLVVRVDADDRVDRRFLQMLAAALAENPAAGYAYPAMVMFGEATGRYHVRAFDAAALVFEGNFVCAGALMRRAVLLEVGGLADLPAWEDWDLWLRFLDAGYEGVLVDEELYAWRRHGVTRNRLGLAQRRALRLRIWWRHRRLVRRHLRRGVPLALQRSRHPVRQQ